MAEDPPIGSNVALTITLENLGGALDCREAPDGENAVAVLMEMVREAGRLRPGDVFRVERNAGRRG